MAYSQSANTTTPTMLQSGTSKKLPKVLPYVVYLDYQDINYLEHTYCYVQEHPANVDLTVLIYRDIANEDVITIFANRSGEALELTTDTSVVADAARAFIKDKLADFVRLMNIIKIEQAQYHFWVKEDGLVLVDVRTAINKCVSPGLIEEVFGKIIRTLKTRTMTVLEPAVIQALIQGQGPFAGDLLLRPSRFRMIEESVDNFRPLYVELKR